MPTRVEILGDLLGRLDLEMNKASRGKISLFSGDNLQAREKLRNILDTSMEKLVGKGKLSAQGAKSLKFSDEESSTILDELISRSKNPKDDLEDEFFLSVGFIPENLERLRPLIGTPKSEGWRRGIQDNRAIGRTLRKIGRPRGPK